MESICEQEEYCLLHLQAPGVVLRPVSAEFVVPQFHVPHAANRGWTRGCSGVKLQMVRAPPVGDGINYKPDVH